MRPFFFFCAQFFCWGIACLLLANVNADPIKRAKKYYNKADWPNTEKFLQKAEKKMPAFAEVDFWYSCYFSRLGTRHYNPDSAFYRALRAEAWFKHPLNARYVKRLAKDKVDEALIKAQIARADSLVWIIAKNSNSVSGYQKFLNEHPQSVYKPEAISKRNFLAFEEAKTKNTYEAYKYFMDKYPDAEQAKNAREISQLIVYETETKSGTMSDLIRFIKNHPSNPYRPRVEQMVYSTLASAHTPESYYQFASQLKGSKYSPMAWKSLYYLETETLTDSSFSKKYPQFPYTDLYNLPNGTLFPILDSGRNAMLDLVGKVRLKGLFDSVSGNSLCIGNILPWLAGFKNGKVCVIDRAGNKLGKQVFDSVGPFKGAIFKFWISGRAGLWHTANFELVPAQYDDLEPLGNHVIFTAKGKKGIISLQQRLRVMPIYDEIYQEGKIIVFGKDNNFGFTRTEKLSEAFLPNRSTDTLQVTLPYQEIQSVPGDNLLVRLGNNWGLLNPEGRPIIPAIYSSLVQTANGWIAQTAGQYKVLNEKGKPIIDESFEKVFFNSLYYGVKQNGKWGVLGLNGKMLKPCENDSLRFYGPNLLMLTRGRNSFLAVKENEWIDFGGYNRTEVLANFGSKTEKTAIFICVTDAQGKKGLFSAQGRQILKPEYERIGLISPNLFALEKKGKTALADSTGKLLLPFDWDGAGNREGKWINMLKNHKFGLYNPETKQLVKPVYEATLHLFSEEKLMFTALKGGKYGVIDSKSKILIPFAYDEIKEWGSNFALVRQENKWYPFNLLTQKQEMLSFSSINKMPFKFGILNETIYRATSEGKDGLISDGLKITIPFECNDIINLGTTDNPVLFVAKKLPDGKFEIGWYNAQGKLLHKSICSEAQYEKLVCEGKEEE